MAKGSVRRKAKVVRTLYIEDESGRKCRKSLQAQRARRRQKPCSQSDSDYEEKQFVGKAENITVGDMLDMWVEEELKPET